MIVFSSNNGRLCQSVDDLPRQFGEDLCLDAETSSGDPKHDSLNPWDVEHCRVAGLALKWRGQPEAFYVPRRLLLQCPEWLDDVFADAKRWHNHSIKYDCHALRNDLGVDPQHVELHCTLSKAKVLDSDRSYKGGYSLEALDAGWLGRDVRHLRKRMSPWLEGAKNLDYGLVPDDVIGEYACQDVIDVDDVTSHIEKNLPEQCKLVAETEVKSTRMLLDVERRGIKITPTKVKQTYVQAMREMLVMEERLAEKLGRHINPKSNADCYDVLCNQFGLPVLKWTEKLDENGNKIQGNPSFDKEALGEYENHVDAPAGVVSLLAGWRKRDTLCSLFCERFLNLNVDGILHSSYNQMVRSGRMSCVDPNAQQNSLAAKMMLEPREGYTLLDFDYKQIEYRLIIHYIRNMKTVRAWQEDPTLDFHVWIAQQMAVDRKLGKTLNFLFGFGGGKKRGTKALAQHRELLNDPNMTRHEMERAATQMYTRYHQNLSELKPTTRLATAVARQRGYVFNAHGRHLHLPYDRAHVGFNRVIQSDAADLMKETILNACPTYDSWLRKRDVHLIAIVHDSALFEVPTPIVEEVRPYIQERLQRTIVQYLVPILADCKASEVCWGLCA